MKKDTTELDTNQIIGILLTAIGALVLAATSLGIWIGYGIWGNNPIQTQLMPMVVEKHYHELADTTVFLEKTLWDGIEMRGVTLTNYKPFEVKEYLVMSNSTIYVGANLTAPGVVAYNSRILDGSCKPKYEPLT